MESFGYVNDVPHWGFFRKKFLHGAGGVAMLFASGRMKKKYNIDDERCAPLCLLQPTARSKQRNTGKNSRVFHRPPDGNQPAVSRFVVPAPPRPRLFLTRVPRAGGAEPNLVDITAFGAMRAIDRSSLMRYRPKKRFYPDFIPICIGIQVTANFIPMGIRNRDKIGIESSE
jgi:hypothetical protein